MEKTRQNTMKAMNILRKLYPEEAKQVPKVEAEWERNKKLAKTTKSEKKLLELLMTTLKVIPLIIEMENIKRRMDETKCATRAEGAECLKIAINAYKAVNKKDEGAEDDLRSALKLLKEGSDTEFEAMSANIRKMGTLGELILIKIEYEQLLESV